MSKALRENPPVLIVGGSDEFQRRRFVAQVIARRRSEGCSIVPVDGKESDALDGVFSTAMMFGTRTLCVVSNPEKLHPPFVAEHMRSPDPLVTLLLVTESDKLTGPVFEPVPDGLRRVFTLPQFFKMEEYATKFVLNEVKERGCSIDANLARSLVRKVGTNLGVLFFEVQKASMLVVSGEITAEALRSTVAPLLEVDGSSITDALGMRDGRRLALEMHKYRSSRGSDPTIELCGRVLTPALTRWMQAAHLHDAGMSAGAAAGSVGANAWYWEHKVLPFALQWGVGGCARLIRAIARAQVAVFQGAINPWALLETSLLRLSTTTDGG